MKMLNFASIDPIIIESGQHGLGNASNVNKSARPFCAFMSAEELLHG
jgi:hypothetical protein